MPKQYEKRCLGKELWCVLVVDKSTGHDKPHNDLLFTTISTSKKTFFQSRSWKRHCVTHWHEQCSMNSYQQWQISQSYCEISSNCGKKLNLRMIWWTRLTLYKDHEILLPERSSLLLLSNHDNSDYEICFCSHVGNLIHSLAAFVFWSHQ